MARRSVFIATLTFAAILGLATVATAQESKRGTRLIIDSVGNEIIIELDDYSLDMADEYVDILEQLQELIEDYTDYVEGLDDEAPFDYEFPVEKLSDRLQDGKYADSPGRLIGDIEDAIDDVGLLERELREADESVDPRVNRVLRSLRRELVIIADLIEDYADQQVVQILRRKDIQEYLGAAFKELVESLGDDDDKRQPVRRDIYIPGQPPAPPTPPETPEARRALEALKALRDLEPFVWIQNFDRKELGLVRQFTDSIRVTSSDQAVFISSPAGSVHITGWGENMIVARLGVEISADSYAKEKEYIRMTSVATTSQRDGYHVVAVLPSISDPETRVLRSLLVVNVPEGNRVECENSFGHVNVSDLSAGIDLKSNYSEVKLNSIRGFVHVTNSMGSTTMIDIEGPIKIKNANSPIEILDCDGDMEVENSYAAVKLTDTRGDVTIKNTGHVHVANHVGSLSIDNNYGQVEVSDVVGDVVASNAYQSLVTTSVTGSATLVNLYSEIGAYYIGGNLDISSTFGGINAEAVGGPVHVTSENGNINLILDGNFRGNSSVSASHATINVTLLEELDLRIKAKTRNGSMESSSAFVIDTDGSFKSAEWLFGAGTDVLELDGNNVDIVINERY